MILILSFFLCIHLLVSRDASILYVCLLNQVVDGTFYLYNFQILGIIDQPILRKRWVGVHGRPTTVDGLPIQTRPCERLSQATLWVYICPVTIPLIILSLFFYFLLISFWVLTSAFWIRYSSDMHLAHCILAMKSERPLTVSRKRYAFMVSSNH